MQYSNKRYIFVSTIKNNNTMATQEQKELGTFLAPLTDLAMQMILAGTLKKNVIKHFTNKGLPFEVAENLTECAVVKAENYQFNKAK